MPVMLCFIDMDMLTALWVELLIPVIDLATNSGIHYLRA